MNILVTGGLGFIGHGVVKKFIELGHHVFVVDNQETYGLRATHPCIKLHDALYKYRLDTSGCLPELYSNSSIADFRLHETGLDNIDLVVHLASYPYNRLANKNPTEATRIMLESLVRLLDQHRVYKIKRFVYVSSSMVYGNFADNTHEQTQCQPSGIYALLKYTAEKIVREYSRQGLETVIVRPSAVYGSADNFFRVTGKFMRNIMHNKPLEVHGIDQRMDFTYVTDTVDGIVGASLSHNTTNKIYNIARGHSRTILECARTLVEIAGRGEVIVQGRDQDYPVRGSLSIEQAQQDFNYSPSIDLEQGLLEYYNWCLEHTDMLELNKY